MTTTSAPKHAVPSGAKFARGVARERVRKLSKTLTPREIAKVMDVSTQNVHYHLKRIEEES